MTADAVSWLPPGTRPPPALQALLAGVVDAWSTRWFVGAPMTLAPLVCDAGGGTWRGLDAGVMLRTAPDATLAIGAAVLDVTADARTPRDRTLLEEVAEECLADLRSGLAQLVGAPPTAEWRPVVRAGGWTAGIGSSLSLALLDALFASLVRRVLPPPPPVVLGSGAAALAATDVLVGASVGRAALTVADLEALEIGDVVVLDHALADPLALAVDGRALPRGRARVVAGDHPFLEIVDIAA